MDKLMAYKILGLENNASMEEVKEAYARLSKEYHPEENPEEFQQIHEAYVTLTRRGRRGNNSVLVDSSPIVHHEVENSQDDDLIFHKLPEYEEEQEDSSQEYDFARSIHVAKEEEEVDKEQFDFDASIEQARNEEVKRLHQMFFQIANELEVLMTPPDCYLLKKFKAFFERKEYEQIFYSHSFMELFAGHLEGIKLSDEIYSYIIGFYSLNGFKYENLVPEAKQLYDAIEKQYSIKKDVVASKRLGMISGVFGGTAFCLLKFGPKILKVIFKSGVNDNIVWIGLAVIIVVWVIVTLISRKKK